MWPTLKPEKTAPTARARCAGGTAQARMSVSAVGARPCPTGSGGLGRRALGGARPGAGVACCCRLVGRSAGGQADLGESNQRPDGAEAGQVAQAQRRRRGGRGPEVAPVAVARSQNGPAGR